MRYRWSLAAIALPTLFAASLSYAHGLVEQPASRAYFCGVLTKPSDLSGNGDNKYAQCADAFKDAPENHIYNYMGILSHSRGAYDALVKGESPSTNVCSFDSTTYDKKASVVDRAINWPTTRISAGKNEFIWNIFWGAHFDDTDHFRYWITKPDFKYQVGKPLQWSDFESKPFCDIDYFHGQENPSVTVIDIDGNPNDSDPEKWETKKKFKNLCTVPERTGHHVIYSEWGRTGPESDSRKKPGGNNERFHSCSDVTFSGDVIIEPPKAAIAPVADTFYGTGSITLDGSKSSGDQLTYTWSIEPNDTSFYKIADGSARATKLDVLKAPPAGSSNTIRITLSVTDKHQQLASDSVTIKHVPRSGEHDWTEFKDVLKERDNPMQAGDVLRLRTVDGKGQDAYYPKDGYALTAQTAQPAIWAYALGNVVNALHGSIKVGVLSADGKTVSPKEGVNVNKVYAMHDSDVQSVYLDLERKEPPPNKGCSVYVAPGASPYHAGLGVVGNGPVVLDFTGTGVNLAELNVSYYDSKHETRGNTLIIQNVPSWTKEANGAYIGLADRNWAAHPGLPHIKAPSCTAQ